MSVSDGGNSRLAGLIAAMEKEDRAAIDQWIRSETFTLVALAAEEGDEDALAALVVETEEFPAVVAFLDTESASQFVDSIADQIEGDSVDLFEVDGDALLRPMSEEFGLIINPESEESIMIDPDLLHDFNESDDDSEEEADEENA